MRLIFCTLRFTYSTKQLQIAVFLKLLQTDYNTNQWEEPVTNDQEPYMGRGQCQATALSGTKNGNKDPNSLE